MKKRREKKARCIEALHMLLASKSCVMRDRRRRREKEREKKVENDFDVSDNY